MNSSPLLGLLLGQPTAGALQVPNIPMPSADQIGQQLQSNFANDMQGLQAQNNLQSILKNLQLMQASSAQSAPHPLAQPQAQPMQPMGFAPLHFMPTSWQPGAKP